MSNALAGTAGTQTEHVHGPLRLLGVIQAQKKTHAINEVVATINSLKKTDFTVERVTFTHRENAVS